MRKRAVRQSEVWRPPFCSNAEDYRLPCMGNDRLLSRQREIRVEITLWSDILTRNPVTRGARTKGGILRRG